MSESRVIARPDPDADGPDGPESEVTPISLQLPPDFPNSFLKAKICAHTLWAQFFEPAALMRLVVQRYDLSTPRLYF